MKFCKFFFKFLKFSFISRCTCFFNILFWIKVCFITAIVVPCLIQSPLVSFGQDGVDVFDSIFLTYKPSALADGS